MLVLSGFVLFFITRNPASEAQRPGVDALIHLGADFIEPAGIAAPVHILLGDAHQRQNRAKLFLPRRTRKRWLLCDRSGRGQVSTRCRMKREIGMPAARAMSEERPAIRNPRQRYSGSRACGSACGTACEPRAFGSPVSYENHMVPARPAQFTIASSKKAFFPIRCVSGYPGPESLA